MGLWAWIPAILFAIGASLLDRRSRRLKARLGLARSRRVIELRAAAALCMLVTMTLLLFWPAVPGGEGEVIDQIYGKRARLVFRDDAGQEHELRLDNDTVEACPIGASVRKASLGLTVHCNDRPHFAYRPQLFGFVVALGAAALYVMIGWQPRKRES